MTGDGIGAHCKCAAFQHVGFESLAAHNLTVYLLSDSGLNPFNSLTLNMDLNIRDYLQGRYIVVRKLNGNSYDIMFISGYGIVGLRKASEFIKNHCHKSLQKDYKIVMVKKDTIECI